MGARAQSDDQRRLDAVKRVLVWTFVLNLLVAIAKIAYGYFAHALSIRADGFHSATDGLNNVIAYVGVWIASHPPDREHPYGHRKFEFFAATVIGVSLLFVAIDVVRDAASRIGGEHLPNLDNRAYAVLLATFCVNAFVAFYEAHMAKKLKSAVLSSDANHTRSDLFVTAGVLLAVFCTQHGYPEVDVLAAVAVALFVGHAGIQVLRQNIDYLADAAPIEAEAVLAIARAVPGVSSAHKARSRGAPGHVFVDLHIQLPPELNVVEAHDLTHRVIDAIKDKLPDVADVTIHTEPATTSSADAGVA